LKLLNFFEVGISNAGKKKDAPVNGDLHHSTGTSFSANKAFIASAA